MIDLVTLQVQILIAIHQHHGDFSTAALAKALALEELSLEDELRILEEQGFVVKRSGHDLDTHHPLELTDLAREYLIENDLYRSFRLL